MSDVIPDVIPTNIQSVKAANLIKAREARQNNVKNKNTSREERIINLVNEIKEEELLKVENKTEKLKNKLMKLIQLKVGRLTEMYTEMLGGVGAGHGSSSTARGADAPDALAPPTPK